MTDQVLFVTLTQFLKSSADFLKLAVDRPVHVIDSSARQAFMVISPVNERASKLEPDRKMTRSELLGPRDYVREQLLKYRVIEITRYSNALYCLVKVPYSSKRYSNLQHKVIIPSEITKKLLILKATHDET